MPTNLKRMVRERMAQTGENYTTALRHVREQEKAKPVKPDPYKQDTDAHWEKYWGDKGRKA